LQPGQAGIDLIIYGLLIIVISPPGLASRQLSTRQSAVSRMTTQPLLSAACATFRRSANADVSMSVAEGVIVGFIGPNGAGKSTPST
jgi:ABC-type uncharacterized transport system ATPase subunit